jgi:hypothetical protein
MPQADSNRMDRIDRIRKEMNCSCSNDFGFILSILSILLNSSLTRLP